MVTHSTATKAGSIQAILVLSRHLMSKNLHILSKEGPISVHIHVTQFCHEKCVQSSFAHYTMRIPLTPVLAKGSMSFLIRHLKEDTSDPPFR